MPLSGYSARVYDAKVDLNGCFEFECVACGHAQSGWVNSTGEGVGESPYGLLDEGARDAATRRARTDADKMLDLTVELVSCPECGFRARGMRYWKITLGVLLVIGLVSGLAALGSPWLAAIGGGVVGLTWFVWRASLYRRATDERRVRFVGYS